MKKRTITADNADLLVAYRQMSQDREREAEAEDWVEGLIEDAVADQP